MATLSRRQLGRATLARQQLLERSALSPVEAVTQLVGLQAQAPLAPYVALWSRLASFDPTTLSTAIERYEVLRTHVMRTTIHLVTATDALAFRGAFRSVHESGFRSGPFAKALVGLDLDAVTAVGRDLLADRAMSRSQLSAALAGQFPGYDPTSLAYAVTYRLALCQPPPRGLWRRRGPATWQPLETLLGKEIDPAPRVDRLLLRYLGAFGPASVADAQLWSGLSRLGEVIDTLRPQLVTHRAEDGTELFDLPDTALPDADTPAPVRFLPEYDNLLLSHADRTRVIPDRRPVPLPPGDGARTGTFLVDGELRGTWRLVRRSVEIQAEPRLRPRELDEVAGEGAELAGFLAG